MAALRVGFVGGGGIALAHAIALSRIAGVAITAVADPILERAQKIAAEFGGQPFADFEDMWDQVDAVWVTTPPYLHCEHTLAALGAGKHVFVEKPLALNLADADKMIGAAERGGLKLAVGEMIRFYPIYREMRRILDGGEIGRPVAVWSRRYSNSTLAYDPQWRWDVAKSGGYVFEWQTHEINTVRYIGGEIVSVCAQVHFSAKRPDYDATMHSLLGFASGATGVIDGSVQFAFPFIERGVMGSEGAIVAKDDETLHVKRLDGDAPRVFEGPFGAKEGEHGRATLRRVFEDQDFIDAIRDGREPHMTGREARADLEVAVAVHQSSRTGAVVKLPLS